jgi:phosphoenolpyruvate synthase/pyruvate phosphate dikinase
MDYIYSFQDECEDKDTLGNKGANLVTMTKLGLPVPPGFIVSVKGYNEYKTTGHLKKRSLNPYLILRVKCMGNWAKV